MGKGMSSGSGSRLDSHTRLFLLFKSHREVIRGKGGKIPQHLFRQRHSHPSGAPRVRVAPLFLKVTGGSSALCVHRRAPTKAPSGVSLQMGL